MGTPLHWPPVKSPERSRRASLGQSCSSGCQQQSYVLYRKCQFLPEGKGKRWRGGEEEEERERERGERERGGEEERKGRERGEKRERGEREEGRERRNGGGGKGVEGRGKRKGGEKIACLLKSTKLTQICRSIGLCAVALLWSQTKIEEVRGRRRERGGKRKEGIASFPGSLQKSETYN